MADRLDAYIAYNHIDEAWSKELASKLERETKDGRLLRVFFAPWDIQEGRNFVLQLNEALERAEFVVVVLSPEAITSDWVTREWTSAMLRDVSGSAGRLLPILRRTCNIPLFLRVLDITDFRNSLDERPYRELVQRLTGQAKTRGGTSRIATPAAHSNLHGVLAAATRPDPIPERLESNLYPIIGLPSSWFATPCNYSSVRELLAALDARKAPIPALLIRNRTLYTFANPRDSNGPLQEAVDARLTQEESIEAALQDPAKRPWVMELIKKRLLVELAHRGVAHDREHDRFFFMKPQEGEEERKEEWRSPKKLARRTVARAKKADGIVLRWEHFACYLRIVDVERTLCLVIEPTWTFTKDGKEKLDSSRVTALAVRKMYRAGNGAVLNDTRFWAAFMAFNKDEIRLRNGQSAPIRISTLPVAVQVGAGLAWDQILPDTVSHPPDQWVEEESPLGEPVE